MAYVERHFRRALRVATQGSNRRQYRLGAVGIRRDGAIVEASNLPTNHPEPRAHAEQRLVRKLDKGSTVFVVRAYRNGELALARPCKRCQTAMRLRGVKACYYSISATEYGVLLLGD
jgi:tRNA(Arg) A34 adenosine deaminase TadA